MTGGTTTGIAENLSDIKGIKLADSPSLDAFGRLRVGNPFPVFDNKNIYNLNPDQWTAETIGVGASITHLPLEAAVALTVGTVSGESAIRQTHRYFAYVPGKSVLITMTGVFGAGKENVTKRIGYFDDNDGIFFEQNDTDIRAVIRSSVSGSPSDVSFATRENWNLDKMDGSGLSGITLDVTKSQIFVIDFQYLGVGRVRMGFDIGGIVIYVHEFNHANLDSVVYMATPSLPFRYEIVNTGTTASPTTLKEICCSLSSEGGYTLPGLEFSKSNGVITRASTVRTPVFAIRLKNSFNGKENRRTVKFISAGLYADTNDAFFEVAHLENPTSITATWSDVSLTSGVEFSTDITAVTGNPEHVIEATYLPVSTGNRATNQVIDLGIINLHGFVSQNKASDNSEMFVIYATSFSGTTDVSAILTWVEFD